MTRSHLHSCCRSRPRPRFRVRSHSWLLRFGLLLLALPGCGDGGIEPPRDMSVRDSIIVETDPCAPWTGVARYRVSALRIPTSAEARADAIVGHDVDRVPTTCGVPDYAGDVDNALIDLVDGLPMLLPDVAIDLQAALDMGLICAVGATDCTRLDVVLEIRTSAHCVSLRVLDGTGASAAVLGGPYVGTRDTGSSFRVIGGALSLPSTNLPNAAPLWLGDLFLTGRVEGPSVSNLVLGGVLQREPLERAVLELLPSLGTELAADDVLLILGNLYDVEVGGTCAGMSVGLTGAATRVPEP